LSQIERAAVLISFQVLGYCGFRRSVVWAPEAAGPDVPGARCHSNGIDDNGQVFSPVAASAGGYRWKVIVDGQTLREGTAPTEIEARTAAAEAVMLLQQAEHRQA
jgi:hypothetical protein